MASNLTLYNSDGSAEVTTFSLTGGSPGSASAAQTFRLVNDDSGGSVDTASEAAIRVLALDDGGVYVDRGVRSVDERWVRIKLTGTASSGLDITPTGFVPVGRGRQVSVGALESGEWVEFQVDELRPGSATADQQTYKLEFEPGQTALALELGHSETGRDGVLHGIGDDSWDEIIYGADVVAQGSPDDTVAIPDVVWKPKTSQPHLRVKLAHDLAINDTDGDSATLASGEAYWCVLSLAQDGSITQTKGSKGTAPLDVADAPLVPTGEIGLARIHRDFDGAITDADITMLSDVGSFHAETSASSLTVAFGHGRALVDNRLIIRTAQTSASLTASESNYVWLLQDGSLAVTTDGERDEARAHLLYILTTNGSGVTATEDRRVWVGGELVQLAATIEGTVDGGETAYVAWTFDRPGVIWPLGGIAFTLHDPGSGNTSGVLELDVTLSDGAGSFDSIYTSSGTDDRRIHIAHDATEWLSKTGAASIRSLPEVLRIERNRLIRCAVAADEAYNGTAPTGATVFIPVYLL